MDYTITLRVCAPPGQAIGIKEAAAMWAERCGDTRVISVAENIPEQMRIGGQSWRIT